MIEEAWAAQEHQHGVLPLIETFFEADLAVGRKRGALGLFTPAPEPGWGAGAIDGEPVNHGCHRLGAGDRRQDDAGAAAGGKLGGDVI